MRASTLFITVLVLSIPAIASPAHGAESPATIDFLSQPTEGEARDIALAFLTEHAEELGLEASDLADLIVQDEYTSTHNGVTHLYFLQRLGGVEVVNGLININVMPDGRIVNVGNRFVSNLSARVNSTSPALSSSVAVERSATHLGVSLTGSPEVLETVGGPALETLFNGANLSRDPIRSRLMYLPLPDGGVRLVWSLVVRRFETADWWNLFVDASTGDVLEKFNWTADTDRVIEREASKLSATPPPATPERVCSTDCYNVFAFPKESPLDGPRSVEEAPWDLTASPFGWHDTDGSAGAEFNDSRGNNVEAQTDINANNVFGPPDIRADGGPSRVFDFPFDPNQGPETYREFAVTNLFYWNNIIHDISYQYGFDEAGGNFQTNNYGRGGAGGDPVQADAQDGSGTNNANFGTPPDGSDPRMQMFIWTSPFGQLATVNSPAPIAGDYDANPSNNGGTANGLTADLIIVDDGVAPTTDGCQAILNNLTGKIALILWSEGLCNSSVFVQNAANAGADAAIIIDNTDVPYTNFGGSAAIPSVAVGLSDGQLFMTTITGGSTVNVTIDDNPGAVNRDSDIDAGIINHEYGHGISNRLVGGPGNVGCVSHTERMGEGWSDWWTLVLSALPGHTGEQARGIGNYSTFRPIDGAGIRAFPYSTDLAVNPQTFIDIGTAAVPHGVGSIWNTMLWEVYWLLVERDGFDADLYAGTGGNNLAIQLVVDGMKMAPCSPTFVEARDAILAADLANNAGANECQIWHGFAKRGLGDGADSGSGNVLGDETESFDVPAGLESCLDIIFADGFESGSLTAWSDSQQ